MSESANFLKIVDNPSLSQKAKRKYIHKKFKNHKPLNVLSLGCGVQSSAIYFLSHYGLLPQLDFCVFADTGNEKNHTMEYLDFLLDFQKKNNSAPIFVASYKNLYDELFLDAGRKSGSIPAFTKNINGAVGMLRRQCTVNYKIRVVNKVIREQQGIKPGFSTPPTIIWIGISLDEKDRMSAPLDSWKTHYYPLISYSATSNKFFKNSTKIYYTRLDCINFLKVFNLLVPDKSSCKICPYMSDSEWSQLKENDLDGFNSSVLLDEKIRNSTAKGVNNPIFLHRSCKPLSSIKFEKNSLFNFGNCTGYCQL